MARRRAEKPQEGLGAFRHVEAEKRNQRAERRRQQERVSHQRKRHLPQHLRRMALRLQADLDEKDRNSEDDADGDDRGDGRQRQRLLAERHQRERKAHEAGVGVAGIQPVDRRVRERHPAHPHGDRQPEDGEAADSEGKDEARTPDGGPLRVGDDVEEQRRQRQIDDEAVELRHGMRAEHAGAPHDPSGKDQGEDRDDRRQGREHGRDRALRSPAPLPRRSAFATREFAAAPAVPCDKPGRAGRPHQSG